VTFEVSDVLGTGVGGSFQPLYSPGAAFLVAAAVTVLIQGVDRDELRTALSRTGTAVVGTGHQPLSPPTPSPIAKTTMISSGTASIPTPIHGAAVPSSRRLSSRPPLSASSIGRSPLTPEASHP
jgi:hypothetical protein